MEAALAILAVFALLVLFWGWLLKDSELVDPDHPDFEIRDETYRQVRGKNNVARLDEYRKRASWR